MSHIILLTISMCLSIGLAFESSKFEEFLLNRTWNTVGNEIKLAIGSCRDSVKAFI